MIDENILEDEENIELNNMIEDMFNEYMADGFDLNTDMTFDEIFKKVFSDAVLIAMDTFEEGQYEDLEEELMDDEDPDEAA